MQNKHAIILILTLLFVNSCSFLGIFKSTPEKKKVPAPGEKVVAKGRYLSFVEERIYAGSCLTFVNSVFNEAGYPKNRRKTVFRSGGNGPYAPMEMLKPGDWVMHINLEFRNVGHSSIFVDWIDRNTGMARTLDHAGMNRPEPGKYRKHRMTHVFRIIRAYDPPTTAQR